MENSTKIIIGSSIAIVGLAAVYFVMSKKRSLDATAVVPGSTPIAPPAASKAGDNTLLNNKTNAPVESAIATSAMVDVGAAPKGNTLLNNKTEAPIQSAIASPTEFGIVPAAGKLLKTYCDGIKIVGEYTDGLGGTVVKVIDAKAQACGYIPPSTDFSDSNDYPEVTAMLINELRVPGLQATLKKWREEELKFRNPNFDSTAPHHGNKSLYQYAIQEMFRHGYSNRRCSVNRDMNDFLIDKRGSNNNGTDFNDWGRSVVNNKDHFNCDYKTENLTLAFINARDVAKANSAGVYARKLASDLINAYNAIFTL